jgi:hypothetical protein
VRCLSKNKERVFLINYLENHKKAVNISKPFIERLEETFNRQ